MEPKSKKHACIPITIVIVDENPTSRKRLKNIINQSEGMQCFAAYRSTSLASKELKKATPDVVITDLITSGMTSGQFSSTLRRRFPSAKVIVRTESEDFESVFWALRGGALGYLLTSEPLLAVIDAIRSVMDGGSPMTARIARIVVESIQQGQTMDNTSLPITFREYQILSSAAIGLKVREIGKQYGISEYTVRAHLRKIYVKLQVSTRCEAVLKLLQSELC